MYLIEYLISQFKWGIIIRAVLRRKKNSGFHPEIWLYSGILVILNNYKNATVQPNFRMKSGNFPSPQYYPYYKYGIGFLFCVLGERFETPLLWKFAFYFSFKYRLGPFNARGLELGIWIVLLEAHASGNLAVQWHSCNFK
jgi:hypothetical protein